MSTKERSSEEIRRDIDRTRADMDETVDRLESRLSPGQLLDQAWGMVKGGGVGDVVRDHPVPLALMGLGVAWLAVEKATGDEGGVGSGTWERAEGRVGPYRGDAIAGDADREDERGMTGKAADAAGAVKEKVTDAAGAVKEKATGAADRAGGRARYGASRAKRGFWSALDDNPLALGAVAFGVGLAGGLAAPGTRWEDRALGDTADRVKDRTKEVARETGRGAKRVAEDAADAAQAEAKRQHLGDDLKESAKRVAREARSAAAGSAEREGLDAETMKARAKEVGEEVRSAARDHPR